MSLTSKDFNRMRAERAELLREIGSFRETSPERVADLNQKVLEIERVLYEHGEPYAKRS